MATMDMQSNLTVHDCRALGCYSDRPTLGFVNRYMRAGGRTVWFRIVDDPLTVQIETQDEDLIAVPPLRDQLGDV